MVRTIALATIRVGRSHLLGMVAQVLGAAPVIAVSIYLSHAVGLAAVADYAVLIGVSAVAFTLGLVGLRSRLVIDQFRVFTEDDYYVLRIIGTGVLTLVILAAGLMLGAPPMLTLAVALMRAGDAALDLLMAVDQVRRDDRRHMYGYINGASVKLVLLVALLALAEITHLLTPFAAFALASALGAIYAWALFLGRRESSGTPISRGGGGRVFQLLRYSVVFAVAQILCALLTSAPRVFLTANTDRELAGAAGAALSVATLIGMSYFAVWLRWAPRFGKEGVRFRSAVIFFAELSIAMLIMLGTIWLTGRQAMALVYGISAPEHLEMTLWTLLSCTVFFFTMTFANLFKATRLPWAESAIHAGGLGAIWLAFTLRPGLSIPTLILIGSLGVATVGILSLMALLRRRRKSERDA